MSDAVFEQHGITGPYADWCGPGALAAIAGISRAEAAVTLGHLKDRAGWAPSPGTSRGVLAVDLLTRGYGLELWSTEHGGWREVQDFARRMRAEYEAERTRRANLRLVVAAPSEPRPVLAPEVEQLIRQQRMVRAQRRRRRAPWRYTVAEWLRSRPVGTWVLRIDCHWIAARNGEVIAGDTPNAEQHGGAPLLEAWRVLPPTHGETMMIDTQPLLKRTEAAERGDLTEIEVRRLQADIDTATNRAAARLDALGIDGLTGKPAPARAEAMAKGPEAVVAADREQEQLRAALEILDYARIRALEALEATRKREAPHQAAAAIKALPKAVAALVKAKAEYARTRAQVEALVSQVTTARHVAGKECPAINETAFEELAAALWRNLVETRPGPQTEPAARLALTGESEATERKRRRGFPSLRKGQRYTVA
ncbi:hypothetical protein [Thioalkalivibrio sp.]|uniref:hypothetical protein n=1 Tax=Thioalkalivibrio sp. TaxID=2093813 RepID=UPI00356157B5